MTRKMKDSGIEWIGEIPQKWGVHPNKRIMSKEKNICDKYDGQDVLSLTMNGVIVRDLENPSGKMPLTFDGYQYVSKGNLLMCLFDIDVTPRCIGIINNDGVTSPAYSQFKLRENAHAKYYYYYYLNLDYTKELLHLAKNLRHSLTESQLGEINVPVPPSEEQARIASFLDIKCIKIDETIKREKQVIEKLKEYKQSVITEAVTKGLNSDVKMKDSGIEWIGEIPEHWQVKRLRYIARCQNGISKSAEHFGKGFPFVSYGDVYRNIELPDVVEGLVESSESDRKIYSVENGDIFFTRTSETIEEIGLICVCKNTIKDATFAGFLIRVRPFTSEIDVNYSKYYFSSNIHRKFFVKEMNLVTRASLSQELLKKLPVLLPNIEEQKQIAAYLDKKCAAIDKSVINKEKLIEKLTEYKKSLIYECVTGKREV